MPLINARDILAFPAGDNSTDTVIGGIHFNVTALNMWNYTYYSNGTFSNGSECFLTFEPYTPRLLPNGTFLNTTSCYSPIDPIGTRAKCSIAFACFFALSIMFTFINLRKHGRLFLPMTKRFHPVGRRWQWYWMLFVSGCAMISGFTGVDVDRYYLPEIPIVLNTLFWFMMLPGTMASVWEGVRHWGSWQERQLVDPDPFSIPQDDTRGKVEFYLPLIFYLFAFLNFFMIVPRNWGSLEEQRDPEQTMLVAEPMATDARFKAAAFLLFLAWCVVVVSLGHSIYHYKIRASPSFIRVLGSIRYIPFKFLLTIPLAFVMVGYEAACAFDFSISPLNIKGNLGSIYGLGWTPIALIFLVHEIYGYLDPNEDRELMRQRRIRGAEIDRELGITYKPAWWRRLNGDHNLGVQESIAKNVREIGGGAATTQNFEGNIEMTDLGPKSKPQAPRNAGTKIITNTPAMRASQRREERMSQARTDEMMRRAGSVLFPTPSGTSERSDPFADTHSITTTTEERGRLMGDTASSTTRAADSERSRSTGSGATLGAPPQKVRSMLDV